MSKELTIYVKPMPKERPRLVSGGRVYTPLKTKAYENAVALSWVAHMACNISFLLDEDYQRRWRDETK